jgi:hypothetical protein
MVPHAIDFILPGRVRRIGTIRLGSAGAGRWGWEGRMPRRIDAWDAFGSVEPFGPMRVRDGLDTWDAFGSVEPFSPMRRGSHTGHAAARGWLAPVQRGVRFGRACDLSGVGSV